MPAAESSRSAASLAWILAGMLLAVAVVAVPFSYWLVGSMRLEDRLEITAHRAGAAHAPENTVAALKRAIEDRADWAEIDVQLTADKQLVIMHDIDLARIGGGKKRVDQATLAEIRALDVGKLFGPEFAGEKIPTFEEILAAAGHRIRLNVELKPHGKSDIEELTRRVVAEIQQAGIAGQCRLCSQSYEGIRLGKQLEPRLEIGYIVATSLGDVTRLEIDFLMIKGSLATEDLVMRAALRKIEVHAWTVNDPAQVGTLLDAGVANIITDDPSLIRARLDEIRALDPIEWLLLRARSALEL